MSDKNLTAEIVDVLERWHQSRNASDKRWAQLLGELVVLLLATYVVPIMVRVLGGRLEAALTTVLQKRQPNAKAGVKPVRTPRNARPSTKRRRSADGRDRNVESSAEEDPDLVQAEV